jgi:hypothetical protein
MLNSQHGNQAQEARRAYTFRLPTGVIGRVGKAARENGSSRSEVVRKALALGLNALRQKAKDKAEKTAERKNTAKAGRKAKSAVRLAGSSTVGNPRPAGSTTSGNPRPLKRSKA